HDCDHVDRWLAAIDALEQEFIMCDDRNPLHCFIPPYMLERMAQSPKNLVSARA
ncbi:bacillolysin, partial [Pseudomonas syringae pv. japonica str. M301072]